MHLSDQEIKQLDEKSNKELMSILEKLYKSVNVNQTNSVNIDKIFNNHQFQSELEFSDDNTISQRLTRPKSGLIQPNNMIEIEEVDSEDGNFTDQMAFGQKRSNKS